MGTTKTGIQDGSGTTLAYCLVLEGYDQIITSWSSAAAALTAWGASDYTSCITGLQRPGVIEQSIAPLRPRIEANTVTFTIFPDANETLARAIAATELTGGVHSRLASSHSPGASTLTMLASTADWTAPGTGYCGTEKFGFSGKSGSTLTTVSRGYPVPFSRNGATTFGRAHRVSEVYGGTLSYPEVTSFPKVWVGKWVGCWVHRVVNGVLDTVAQAQCIFSGRIADVGEAEDGTVTLTCLDARDAVASQVLLADQWSALPVEGVSLSALDYFELKVEWLIAPSTYGSEGPYRTAAGGGYIPTGFTKYDELIDGINAYIASLSFTDIDSAAINYDESTGLVTFGLVLTPASGTLVKARATIKMTRPVAALLGYDIEAPTGFDDEAGLGHAPYYESEFVEDAGGTSTIGIPATFAPAYCAFVTGNGTTLTFENASGTFIDQDANVPEPWKSTLVTPAGGTWGFVRFDQYVYLAQYTSTTLKVHWDEDMLASFHGADPWGLLRLDDYYGNPLSNAMYLRIGTIVPRFKQVVLLEEAHMQDWLIKTFASTGQSGYNHATYDAYDAQLGLAIPWDLLGDNFVNTATAMANDYGFHVLIEKPTVFGEILLPELAIRNAHLVMRDGGLMFARPSVIDAASATHTLTGSDKAARPPDAIRDWPQVVHSRSWIVNTAKIEYDRDLEGKYHRTVEISNETSKTDFGQSEPVTIRMRNSLQLFRGISDDSIRPHIAAFAGDMLEFHSRPIQIVTRSISAAKWFMAPGDSVKLTDSFVRSTTDGTRGITIVPGWITKVSQNWTTMIGEVEIALHGTDQLRRTVYSPSAFVDAGQATDGYDHANKRVYLVANTFSLAAEDDDITHFAVGDKVRVLERSPATPGSPTNWADTIAAVGANYVDLTTGLGSSGALTGATWYLISDDYATAVATQKVDCYLSDDADGKIVDTDWSRVYIQQPLESAAYTAANTTDLIEWPCTDGSWGNEGEPVTPLMHRALVTYGNNLVNRRTRPSCPWITTAGASTTTATYVLAAYPFRMYLGSGRFTALQRLLNVGPVMTQTISGTGKVRVTSSRFPPTSSSAITGGIAVTFTGPTYSIEWANTSTSRTNVTAQGMNLIPRPGREYTWITIEHKTTANTTTLHGFHEWWLGALQ